MENKKLINLVLDEYEKIFNTDPIFKDEKSRSEVETLLNEGSTEWLVLHDEEQANILGFCIFYRKELCSYEIDYLGIPERYQGKGYGKVLLNEVIKVCFLDPLITTLELYCVDDKIPFYEKFGFGVVEKIDIWNKMINKK